ncbi:MAG TPA: Gfo/Idh/MocA family oxidoreductase [Cyclobacteriaceae bacterium]|jgi:predicted dehydrogenase|nr:Gfo/Idh/MocA family oxidoreductase [Cytophagales bacterium]HRE67008.1 Gfo/Idh/MocA family oxidoreductase [Cyclobacteriaceae bacterium]HRF33182.1 Gfo/Idh/MocA family oxidoreductase [Cyclobacteriaceae bacterium]
MDNQKRSSRRGFIKKLTGTALGAAVGANVLGGSHKIELLNPTKHQHRIFGPNDQVNVAIIGMGIMGFDNAFWTLKVPGVKLVAVCDLYSGRLERAKEVYGKELFVTKNYKEILDRKDIDAVIIATSDHWHDRISIDAMNKGKHVYCEKPMVHRLDEGAEVIATQKKTGKVFIVGSQRVSSIVTQKTKEIFEAKTIGDLIMVETWMDRHSANGAWQYSIPTDANTNTVDWDNFLGDAPKRPYDPVRFFRWRNYQDYGTGVAGDLFVHLFSALHAVTSSKGPDRILATGGLRYWKDGRDVPDVIMGLYDYPETKQHPAFNLQMRVNFVDGSEGGEGLRLIGTDGVIDFGWDSVKVKHNKIHNEPGYGGWDSFDTFTAAQQKEYEKWYKAKYPTRASVMSDSDLEYKAPEEYSANLDHHVNFYKGIREKTPIVEDALFGMRAAGPALATNKSYYDNAIIKWNPETAQLS